MKIDLEWREWVDLHAVIREEEMDRDSVVCAGELREFFGSIGRVKHISYGG